MDFLIQNGMVFDSGSMSMVRRDIAIHQGKIADPEPGHAYRQVIDARDCIVSPGLIDYHVHYFLNATDGGVGPDAATFCCGITTVVDGGSCGTGTYELYRRTIMNDSEVRILNQLLIASGGQSNNRYPENLDPALFDEDKILEMFRKYPDNLVGIKTRISNGIISAEMAPASVARTVEIAEKAGTRVVVHASDCPIPLDQLADMLRPGDVICHVYQGKGKNISLDADGKVLPGLWKARERGILFDAANGKNNYDLEVCRAAMAQGFLPDLISSDFNASSCFLQPLHSLPRILSKYLDFGMSPEQVLAAATSTPAKLIGRPELGCMDNGTPADICILRLKKKPISYSDIRGHSFTGTQILVPMMTFKDGRCMYCQADFG